MHVASRYKHYKQTDQPATAFDGGKLVSATQYAVKIVVTAGLVVLISELSKRSTLLGALLASIPLVSVLAMIWLYAETRDVAQVAALSRGVFWLVLPSLALFLLLPALLERGYAFYASLAVSLAATIAAYYVTIVLARQLGLKL
jgi:hypothetical protein